MNNDLPLAVFLRVLTLAGPFATGKSRKKDSRLLTRGA